MILKQNIKSDEKTN